MQRYSSLYMRKPQRMIDDSPCPRWTFTLTIFLQTITLLLPSTYSSSGTNLTHGSRSTSSLSKQSLCQRSCPMWTNLSPMGISAHGTTFKTAKIIPILPKPSQQTIERDWPRGTLCSVPHSTIIDVFMDAAQNLIAVAYIAEDQTLCIDLRALDGDCAHSQAARSTLFPSDLSVCTNMDWADGALRSEIVERLDS
ncbi:hypothetical protein EDB19DRAFT_189711 [Suillus lakei]|nr:hypothetical protein EDB19DRAFT_189711 [Suillus lakei]